ncbi:MAG: radical SAM family heme chaperone HemW [Verrucomicrobiia bacterium]|jgi:oxygen-independent coproporphyrinogen-3 oxidase
MAAQPSKYSFVSTHPPEPLRNLYIHVPFCAHKCSYCAFYSHAPDGDLIDRYVSALIRELEFVAADLTPDTVFFGGGTPSMLSISHWKRILGAMERLELLGASEWTVECNPATVSSDKARLLRDFGVNRISMGVQSLDASLLDKLGRIHTRDMVFKSFNTLRKAGFDNLNLDLMFAIPGQTMDMWKATLAEIATFESEHLSCYEVIYEEDTPLFAQMKAGEFDLDAELAAAMHEELTEFAEENGYQQYEIANFARNPAGGNPENPSLACRHNINYWRGGSYFGLGPSAAGYERGVRTKNWSNTQIYCEHVEQSGRAIESREELGAVARAGETAAFGLRMNAGWLFDEFRRISGADLREEWTTEMDQLVKLDYARRDETGFQLTPQGLRYADWAAELFLRAD